MREVKIALVGLKLEEFLPTEAAATIKISYKIDNAEDSIIKKFKLQDPEAITDEILKEIKAKGKIEIQDEDDFLGSLFVIRMLNEEKAEEILINFFARLCDKARILKHTTNSREYMKLFDEIKITEMKIPC